MWTEDLYWSMDLLSEWTCITVPCWWPSRRSRSSHGDASFGVDCSTDRPRHSAFALSPLQHHGCDGTAFRWMVSPPVFREKSHNSLSYLSRHSNRLLYVFYCHLVFSGLCVFYFVCRSIVFFAVFGHYATLILLVFTLCYISWDGGWD